MLPGKRVREWHEEEEDCKGDVGAQTFWRALPSA